MPLLACRGSEVHPPIDRRSLVRSAVGGGGGSVGGSIVDDFANDNRVLQAGECAARFVEV